MPVTLQRLGQLEVRGLKEMWAHKKITSHSIPYSYKIGIEGFITFRALFTNFLTLGLTRESVGYLKIGIHQLKFAT